MAQLSALGGRTLTHVAAAGSEEGPEAEVLGHSPFIACLELLQRENLLELEAVDEKGMTPLLTACASGAASAVKWLLEQNADIYKTDSTNSNAMHIAAQRGHRRTVRLLAYYDSDFSRLRRGQDWKGRRPHEMFNTGWTRGGTVEPEDLFADITTIWEAAKEGDMDLLDIALKCGEDVDSLSPCGWTAAMYASAGGHAAVLRQLFSMKCLTDPPVPPGVATAKPNVRNPPAIRRGGIKPGDDSLRPTRGRGPLHLAAEHDHGGICTVLGRFGGADLEKRMASGYTPIMSACRAGAVNSVMSLLKLKADIAANVDEGQTSSRSIMHLLAEGGEEKHAAVVRSLGATVRGPQLIELLERGTALAISVAKTGSRVHEALKQAAHFANKNLGDDIDPDADDGGAPGGGGGQAGGGSSTAAKLAAAEAALKRLDESGYSDSFESLGSPTR